MGSEAVALKVIVPVTVPEDEDVIETVGAVVSGAEDVVVDADVDWVELFPAAS